MWGTMRVRRAMPACVRVGALAAAALVIALTGGLSVDAKAGSNATVANNARVAGDRERTRFIADLSKKVDVHVFALGNPYRVIVDAPDVNFQMPDGIGTERRGRFEITMQYLPSGSITLIRSTSISVNFS